MKAIFFIGILKAILKTFGVLYLLILPILLSEGKITSEQLGYFGTVIIAGTFLSGLVLSYIPSKLSRGTNLLIALLLILISIIIFALSQDNLSIVISYLIIGIALGIGYITADEIAANVSEKGNRFGSFANMAMISDTFRIAYPALAGAIYLTFKVPGLIVLAFISFLIAFLIVLFFSRKFGLRKKTEGALPAKENPLKLLKGNKRFSFVLFIELFDSFASSQLFVFLPTLLVFKGFAIEYAVALQSVVFLGYFSGRLLVSILAKKFSGYTAITIAESGMIITLILLIVLPQSFILYLLCFLLGIFARGTSPVIKALVFDTLEPEQTRRGSALYMMMGDGGSGFGQLVFGLFLAWFGVVAPFIGSAFAAFIVVLACLSLALRKRRVRRYEHL